MDTWAFEPPRNVLSRKTLNTLAPHTIFSALISSLFSLALADTYVFPMDSISMVAFRTLLNGLAFFGILFLIFQIMRFFISPPSFNGWLKGGILAILPLHLALPAALLCKPLGVMGTAAYGFVKILLLWTIIRRLQDSAEMTLHCSRWAAALLVMSPFLLGAIGLLFILGLSAFGIAAGLLGLAASS